jgi:ferric-dicitrate binding protein FerR (iron transport regulator)
MPKDNAIGSKRLDGRYSVRAEKPLKTIQSALPFKHQTHNGALRCGLALGLHSSGR